MHSANTFIRRSGLTCNRGLSTMMQYSHGSAAFPINVPTALPRFQPTCLITEADLNVSPKYAPFPIRKFSLAGLRVDSQRLIDLVKPYYQTMEWDHYDIRREQVQRITQRYQDQNLTLSSSTDILLKAYYKGDKNFNDLLSALPSSVASENFVKELQAIMPYRKKAATTFHVTFEPTITIKQMKTNPIAQLVTSADIRSIPRVYPDVSSDLLRNPLFHDFLQKVCGFVKSSDPNIVEMDFVLWQTSLTPTKQQAADNSPEGIHQDGADYIISALVMERENIEGGESVIYEDDKKSLIYKTILNPGEGLFQADSNSPLWHSVTKVTVSNHLNSTVSYGKRNSLGFDFINIVKR